MRAPVAASAQPTAPAQPSSPACSLDCVIAKAFAGLSSAQSPQPAAQPAAEPRTRSRARPRHAYGGDFYRARAYRHARRAPPPLVDRRSVARDHPVTHEARRQRVASLAPDPVPSGEEEIEIRLRPADWDRRVLGNAGRVGPYGALGK